MRLAGGEVKGREMALLKVVGKEMACKEVVYGEAAPNTTMLRSMARIDTWLNKVPVTP